MDNLSLIEQLDQAVDALLANPDAPVSAPDAEIESLLRVAAELRDLPRENFRLQLKQNLETNTRGATTAEVMLESTPAVNPVREGFGTVTPYLVVRKVHEVIEFVKNVFDAEGKIYGIGSQGGIHSEFKIADTMMMIGGGEARGITPMPAALHIYVTDVDEVYQRAIAAGATSLAEPSDQEYGERSAAFVDPGGNHWYPATAMGTSYIMEGAQELMPYLHPRGAERQIEFLQQAFGAEEELRHASPQGYIYHAKLKIGDSIVELGEAHDQWQPMPAMFMLYVEDVDAWYARAIAAPGAESRSEPADQPYGDRVGAVTDPFGNVWYIASHIKDVT
jgi:PhnB protein